MKGFMYAWVMFPMICKQKTWKRSNDILSDNANLQKIHRVLWQTICIVIVWLDIWEGEHMYTGTVSVCCTVWRHLLCCWLEMNRYGRLKPQTKEMKAEVTTWTSGTSHFHKYSLTHASPGIHRLHTQDLLQTYGSFTNPCRTQHDKRSTRTKDDRINKMKIKEQLWQIWHTKCTHQKKKHKGARENKSIKWISSTSTGQRFNQFN